MIYPNKQRILPCGEKVKGRDCRHSRRSLDKYKPVLIRFVTRYYRGAGQYLSDYGGVYGSTGKPFGWSKEIGNRVKYHPGKARKHPLIETMIHFPPSENSRYCRKDNKDTICDKVDWSVRAGNGFFIVKLIFGDPTVNSKIDIQLNGKDVYNGIVKKGEQKTIEKKIEAKEQFIKIESICKKDCNYAMAKLSAVEIMPFVDMPKPPKSDSLHQKPEVVGCGGALTKGNLINLSNLKVNVIKERRYCIVYLMILQLL